MLSLADGKEGILAKRQWQCYAARKVTLGQCKAMDYGLSGVPT